MFISKNALTSVALRQIKPHVEYERAEVADRVASLWADDFYIEFGGTKGMSLETKDQLKQAFYKIAMDNIEWTKCNQKRDPEEYADGAWRILDKDEML